MTLLGEAKHQSNLIAPDIWIDENDNPIRAEILYDGRRILTLTIKNFQTV